jgi:hypothetical protein
MLRRPTVTLVCSFAIGVLGLVSARSAQAKDPEIKDGLAGTVVKVDVNAGTVTIADQNNRERTYSITEETVIVGPRGGVVHRRLKDHRFHSGLPITVVANGTSAAELHLGYDRKSREGTPTPRSTTPRTARSPSPATNPSPTSDTETSTPSSSPTPASTPAPQSTPATRTTRFRGLGESKRTAAKDTAKSDEEEDEDSEFPGKVKSVDPAKRLLVITLVNGKDRSFLLASDVKVMVNSRASRRGLNDTALQPGASLTVITEAGGRKVKEVKVSTAASRRVKKAA